VDNDIRFDGLRPPVRSLGAVPASVARTILDRVSDVAKKNFTVEEWQEARQTCADIFSPVFKLLGPAGLELYVAPREFVLGNSVDYFVMYNPQTRIATKSPPLIYTKWSKGFEPNDPLLKRPIVRMEPAAGGRPPLLVVEERTHNGTDYNAVVYRYFEIGSDMSLAQVLAVEARALLPSDGNDHTERTATFLTANRVRIDVSSRSPQKLGAQGSVLLERSHSGQAFHVAQRMPAPGTRQEVLLTYCDTAKSDDDFLRMGCDFYY
jgi:hypothetical protein